MLSKNLYSDEESNLFNPAYVGFLIYSSIRAYSSQDKRGMHPALPYVIAPLALNNQLSNTFPQTSRTPFYSWIQSNEGKLIDFASQAEAFLPIVEAALSFLGANKLIRINKEGYFHLSKENRLPKSSALFSQSDEMSASLKSSKLLGTWFAKEPNVETIFVQLGIKP